MTLSVVILAAGQGKRMRSALPKVLHAVAGKPMIEHVLDVAAKLSAEAPIIIHGYGGEPLMKALDERSIIWIEQSEQLGTGHAVAQALTSIPQDAMVLILYGDVPLLRSETLRRLVSAAEQSGFGLLTIALSDPAGYGRIVRDPDGDIVKIVEHKDASADELDIDEVNTGIMALRGAYLHEWIPQLSNDNAQGEYYLTDCVTLAVGRGLRVASVQAADEGEVLGVNDRIQLAELERIYRQRTARKLMEAGVSLRDPDRIDVRGSLDCGQDVRIDVNVVFEGPVKIGDNVAIGPNNVISDTVIGDNVEILPNCVIESARIGSGARIGPFARVRPEAEIGNGVHIGNFVEVKKSRIGDGSKVNHLSYIGDSEIGCDVNVGAGTITCNYDGAYKHKTVIEDDVFIGSGTQLVAPVTVGKGATVGAGTTVTEDVAPDRLVISRVRQRTVSGWSRPTKGKK